MRARAEAGVLLVADCAIGMTVRMAQVALPLVVLAETGSVAATGLVGGATGIPVWLSPWWARRARQWVDSGRRLMAVMLLEVAGVALVPAAAVAGLLSVVVLVTGGLLLGAGMALAAPGITALLADVGDRLGPDRAIGLLLIQDGLARTCMIVGPPLGALAVGLGLALPLLWLQAGVILLAGLVAWPAGAARTTDPAPATVGEGQAAPSIWSAVAVRPDIARGWLLRAVGSFTFPAFVLGLSVIGAEHGRPGVDTAIGMTGFGVGAVLGTAAAARLVRRVSAMPLACGAWAGAGLCWIGIGWWLAPIPVAVVAPVAGVLTVLGISATSAIITRSASGPERRALLSGQTVVVNAGSSAGMLLAGPLIARVGPPAALMLAGVLMTGAAAAVCTRAIRRAVPEGDIVLR